MANLKLDLLNKLRNDKYFSEIELIRLAQDPSMNYKQKINEMEAQLALISLLNEEMKLVEQYFQEPPEGQEGQKIKDKQPMPNLNPNAATYAVPDVVPNVATTQPVVNQPKGKVHPGQTHGE